MPPLGRPAPLGVAAIALAACLAAPPSAYGHASPPAASLLPEAVLDTLAATSPPEPAGWYAGDLHVHRSCGGAPVSLSTIQNAMSTNDVSIASILADMGNGEVQNPATDLPKVNGANDPISTSSRILHWDAEWHWDATYGQYAHQALGGHLVLLGLQHAEQIWSPYTQPILDWAHAQGAIGGFAHFQYLDDGIPTSLTCCTPFEYPVEVALGNADFISEDVNGGDAATHAYYRLLNCGFRPGFGAGSDYPCASTIGPLLTYGRTPNGALSYAGWIDAIAKGRTVVSRVGHSQFVALTVNGTATPGSEVALATPGTVPVNVTWTVKTSTTRTIELVKNGMVIASQTGTATAHTPFTMSANVAFATSGWLCARVMGANGHEVHTAAVYVTVAGAPVRASASDAEFYVRWIDSMLANTVPGGPWAGLIADGSAVVRARYQAARDVYAQIALEAGSASATTLFQAGDAPSDPNVNDGQPIEVGVRFRSAVDGAITALRYWKGANNGGTHVGHLWTGDGTPLAEATYTGETASGWQQVALASPVTLAPGATYLVSVYSTGGYSSDASFFVGAWHNGPLTALADGEDGPNGVFGYGPSQFPTQSFLGSNYWVDVVFAPADTVRPAVASAWPVDGATDVARAGSVRAAFSEPMDSTTLCATTLELRAPGGAVVPASVTYDAATATATLTPDQPLDATTAYTASVRGAPSAPCVRDLSGNAAATTTTWTFTTGTATLAVPGPAALALRLGAQPNPARGHMQFTAEAPRGGATLELLDVTGRTVRRFATPAAAGRWTVAWDARDDAGRALPAGLYFARLRAGGAATTVRIALIP